MARQRPGTATAALGSGSGPLSPHKLTASAESGLFDVVRACPAHLPCSRGALEPRELRPPAPQTGSGSACARVLDGRFSLGLWANNRHWKRARLCPVFVRVWSSMRHVRHTRRCRATNFFPFVVSRPTNTLRWPTQAHWTRAKTLTATKCCVNETPHQWCN